jgi:DNA-binding NarL/FixJ family response regulator
MDVYRAITVSQSARTEAMSQSRIIRIMIADDHPMMREGLRSTLEDERDMKVVAEVSNGAEAIEHFGLSDPDVVLMDLQMPRVDGTRAIAAIREQDPQVPIVVLTTYPGDARVTRAMAVGATSYLLKTASSEEIIATIRAAFCGRRHVAPDVLEDVSAHQGMEALSPRELSVLRLASQGMSNREIGESLHIAEETVKTRMKSILSKLNAHDRTHAVTIAIHRGFLDT